MVPAVLGTGRFELRGTLGAGGAGTVYRVLDRQLGREVALKHLRHASGRDLVRFKREFRALADITHPGLVQLHELHADDDGWYFTMELVEGVSFIDWVRPPRGGHSGPKRTRQDIADAAVDGARLRGAIIQLADALLALHRAGKLHRDLKPSNVLVTPQGRVALLDFGLVAHVAEHDPDRLAVGTPAYMSPEQASDRSLTEASDWYGLGAMLYEALVGRRPFEGEPTAVMTRKQRETPASPLRVAPHVAPDLAELASELLATSPEARPGGLAILRKLGAAPSHRTRAITGHAPAFVGRGREQDELARALADARTHGVTVLVRGASGIGKTALVRRFLRGLGDRVVVLEGRCFEREQVPFKMLDGVVDMLTTALVPLPGELVASWAPRDVGALVRLFPVMRRVGALAELEPHAAVPADPAELRRRGFSALRHVLARLARVKQVALFIDDAHWGDADSAAFLAELIHPGEPSILTIVAHRPEDYLGVIAKLGPPSGRRGDARELALAPLDDDEARALVDLIARDPGRAEAVVAAGAGNPLVLAELARAGACGGDAPATMAELVQRRVAQLRPDAQAMLAVSSIAARPLPIEIAARAASVVGGHDEAAELAAERLATVRHADGAVILQPAHDHVRLAVLASLDVEAKAYWHEALALAFDELRGDPQAVVEHWLAAGHPANAAHHAVAAAQRAEEALAFRRAAELYEIAIAYGPWDASGQRDLLRRKAEALVAAGQLDAAAAAFQHAAELVPADDAEAIDLSRLAIEALLRRGRLDEALPAAAQLLAHIGVRSAIGKSNRRPRLSAPWFATKLRGLDFIERAADECSRDELSRVDVLYSLASGLAFVDPASGRTLQPELLRAALECGEPVRVCFALAQEVCYAAAAGSRNAAVVDAVGARLAALAQRLGHPHVQGIAEAALGIASVMNGRWLDARSRLDGGLDMLRDHGAGVRWEIDVAEMYSLVALFQLGDWRELVRRHHALLEGALERGDVVAQLAACTGHGSFAWLVAGKPDEARAQLAAARAALPAGFTFGHALAISASCNLALYVDDAAAGARELAAAWPELERIGLFRQQHMRVELHHLRARLALADRDPKLSETLADELAREGVPWATGLAQLVRASASALRDAHDIKVLDALDAAEETLAGAAMTGWLHVARMRRGMVAGGQGAHARAAAARDALCDAGVAAPEQLANVLVPWPV
ncbi:MAG TPA: serine/threonine-protein kinase [Kofleriaceae bacterium]|jgi:tetratricopeptide (TPR) repeat protein